MERSTPTGSARPRQHKFQLLGALLAAALTLSTLTLLSPTMHEAAADPAPADDTGVATSERHVSGNANNTGPWPGDAITTIENSSLLPKTSNEDANTPMSNVIYAYVKAGETFAWQARIDLDTTTELFGSFRIVAPDGEVKYQWQEPENRDTGRTDGIQYTGGALGYQYTSDTTGVWMFAFDGDGYVDTGVNSTKRTIHDWHIGVLDANGETIPGRVFSELYHIGTETSTESPTVALYPMLSSGVGYEVIEHEFMGVDSVITVNNLGIIGATTCEVEYGSVPMRASVELDGIGANYRTATSDSGCDEFEAAWLFLDPPAADLPTVALNWADGRTDNTWLRPEVEEPSISTPTFTRNTTRTNEGTITATLQNAGGGASALIWIDADGRSSELEDADMMTRVDITGDTLSYDWDGNDDEGNPVPISANLIISVQVDSTSPIHFVREDTEYIRGLEIRVIRGAVSGGDKLYWDDSIFADSSGERNAVTTPITGDGVASSGGVHGWTPTDGNRGNANNGVEGSWGDYRLIHDWAYADVDASFREVTVEVDPLAPQLTLDKQAELSDTNQNGKADAGESIQYAFTVTNTGTGTATDVHVTDPKLAAAGITITPASVDIDPGASATFTTSAALPITETDVVAGQVENTATAGGSNTSEVTDTETISTVDATATLTLEKTATLTDANGNGTADAGEQIAYAFTVTNTGTVTAQDVAITDDLLTTAGLAITPATQDITPGAAGTFTVNGSYTVTETDLVAGQVANTATAQGTNTTTSTDSTTTSTTAAAATLTLDKVATLVDENGNDLADAGEQIAYAFKVTNTGNVTAQDVMITDEQLAAAGITIVEPAQDIAPGASVIFSVSGNYTVTETDVVAGQVENTATAEGSNTGTATDTATISTVAAAATLTLDKVATLVDENGNDLADAGEEVAYAFKVTNTGNITAQDVTITDEQLAAAGITIVEPAQDIAPGASVIFSVSGNYTVTETDVVAGQVENTATAEGSNTGTATDTATVTTVTAAAVITLEKQAVLADTNNNGVADAGEQIGYAFVVTNTGNVTATDVQVTDAMLTEAGISITEAAQDIAPGASHRFTADATYTVTEADVLTGDVTNTATATGTNVTEVTDTAVITTVEATAALTLDKQAVLADTNGNGVADAGEAIGYAFTVTNTGNVTATDVQVTDPTLTAAGISVTEAAQNIAPGDSFRFTASANYTVTEADLLAGQVANTATAQGTNTDAVTDTAVISTVEAQATLTLEKTAQLTDTNSNGVADAGETITYGFTVTNTGNVTATDVHVTDVRLAQAGITIVEPAADIAPGASATFTTSGAYTVTEADVLTGQVENTAIAGGTNTESVTDTATVTTVTANPEVALEKQAVLADTNGNGQADAGEQIGYAFVVTNTGNITATGVQVTDPMLAAAGITVVESAQNIVPGASFRFTASANYTVGETDLLAGQVENTATATGTNVPEVTDTTTTSTVTAIAELTLEKIGVLADTNENGVADAGEAIGYAFVVTNTGNVTATDVQVTDALLAEVGIGVTQEATDIAPGGSLRFTADAVYTVTETDVLAGVVENTATATGTNTDEVTDTSSISTVEAQATLVIDKTAQLADTNSNGRADEGEEITWTFTVTNAGTVSVTDVAVQDAFLTEAGITPVLTDAAVTATGATDTTDSADATVSSTPAATEDTPDTDVPSFFLGTQVALTEDEIGQVVFARTLAPGQSLHFTTSEPYTVAVADVVDGAIVNTATATGTPLVDVPLTSSEDTTTTPFEPTPTPTPTASSGLADTGAGDLGTIAALAALLLLAGAGGLLLRRRARRSPEDE